MKAAEMAWEKCVTDDIGFVPEETMQSEHDYFLAGFRAGVERAAEYRPELNCGPQTTEAG